MRQSGREEDKENEHEEANQTSTYTVLTADGQTRKEQSGWQGSFRESLRAQASGASRRGAVPSPNVH